MYKEILIMTKQDAEQIAKLLNQRNQLSKEYTHDEIIKDKENYVFEKIDGLVVACAECKKVQWYQHEIRHISVHEKYEGKGYGKKILKDAEKLARCRNARVIQCTIRSNNESSIRLFTRNGYTEINKFYNFRTENWINIYQKVICVGEL